jgi:hypothetical protein
VEAFTAVTTTALEGLARVTLGVPGPAMMAPLASMGVSVNVYGAGPTIA